MQRRWDITYHHGSLTLTNDCNIVSMGAEEGFKLSTLADVRLIANATKITNGPSPDFKPKEGCIVKASFKINKPKLPADDFRICCSPEKSTDSTPNEWCTISDVHIHTTSVWAWIQADITKLKLYSSRKGKEGGELFKVLGSKQLHATPVTYITIKTFCGESFHHIAGTITPQTIHRIVAVELTMTSWLTCADYACILILETVKSVPNVTIGTLSKVRFTAGAIHLSIPNSTTFTKFSHYRCPFRHKQPSCRHTTVASLMPQPSSHTVPHCHCGRPPHVLHMVMLSLTLYLNFPVCQ